MLKDAKRLFKSDGGDYSKQYKDIMKTIDKKVINYRKAATAAKKVKQFMLRTVPETVKFRMTSKQKAFGDNAVTVILKPSFVGSSVRFNIASFFAKAYLIARKQVPRNAKFNLTVTYHQDDWHQSTKVYKMNQLSKLFDDIVDKLTNAQAEQ